jgi:hypothetical protein
MKMKKKQKTGAGTIPAPHPGIHAKTAGDRNSTAKSPGAGLSGFGQSLSGLVDRTRAYFRQAGPVKAECPVSSEF